MYVPQQNKNDKKQQKFGKYSFKTIFISARVIVGKTVVLTRCY
jgi:hypothetical protein